MQPWEPWPARLAAKLFLERLDVLQREMLGAGHGDEIVVVQIATSYPLQIT